VKITKIDRKWAKNDKKLNFIEHFPKGKNKNLGSTVIMSEEGLFSNEP